LSLAIGKEGQNARLAAKLTGWRIDIKSESEAVDEGLDRLSQAQAQALSTPPILGDDLMARAEQFLRGGEDDEEVVAKPLGEDALSQAARALGEMGAGTSETAEGMSFDLPSFDDVLAQTDTDFSLPAEMPELPVFDDLPEIPALPDEDAAMLASESEEAAVEVEPAAEAEDEESMLSGKDLPEVITADMLRARMAQRRDIDFSDEDFEIPAELLVGLDEDEEVDEDWELSDDKRTKRAKSSKVGKTEKKPAKKRKKQRPSGDDDFDNFY
jgi:hypothetical protein